MRGKNGTKNLNDKEVIEQLKEQVRVLTEERNKLRNERNAINGRLTAERKRYKELKEKYYELKDSGENYWKDKFHEAEQAYVRIRNIAQKVQEKNERYQSILKKRGWMK